MSISRRGILNATGALAIGQTALPAAAAVSSARARKTVLMKLGTQEPTSEKNFQRFQRYGVRNVCGWYKIQEPGRLYPSVEELMAVKALGDKYGISIDMTDSDIGRGAGSAIMKAGPERDREIEAFQKTIENCAAAGIPKIKYYLPFFRSCAWTAFQAVETHSICAGITGHCRRPEANGCSLPETLPR